jgi:hypothetical protein
MNGCFVADGVLYWDNSNANSATLMLPVSLVAGTSRKKGWRKSWCLFLRPIVSPEIRDRRLGSVYNDEVLVAGIRQVYRDFSLLLPGTRYFI